MESIPAAPAGAVIFDAPGGVVREEGVTNPQLGEPGKKPIGELKDGAPHDKSFRPCPKRYA